MKAYVLVDGVPVPLPGGEGGGSVVVNTLVSESRPSIVTAGTAFDVPNYTVGANSLQVFVNGLLCIKGEQYNEVSTTTISFTFDLPVDYGVVVISSDGGDSMSTQTETSTSRDADIQAGSAYSVPAYTVGSNMLNVYLNGLLMLRGVDYNEVNATAISFTSTIPKDFEIVVIASVTTI